MNLFIQIILVVATVLTVYGIETQSILFVGHRNSCQVATVLTVYGIETRRCCCCSLLQQVATVLTVYGIETCNKPPFSSSLVGSLQQYLPFTVLKRISFGDFE